MEHSESCFMSAEWLAGCARTLFQMSLPRVRNARILRCCAVYVKSKYGENAYFARNKPEKGFFARIS